MKIIGVIPARYDSTRFPGKPLVKILGKSLIRRVYERAALAKLQKLIVATDDERIVDEVLSFGGEVVLTKKFDTGTDRVAEVIKKEVYDIVVNIQGDEPLIKPEVIDVVIYELVENAWAGVSTAATRIYIDEEIDDPNVVKVVLAKNGRALYFSRSRIPYNRESMGMYYKHIGIYVYKRDFLERFVSFEKSSLEIAESLEQLRVLENGCGIHVSIVNYDSIGVDIPEDVKKVEELLKAGKQ